MSRRTFFASTFNGTHERVLRLLERRGVLDPDKADPLTERSPVLAGMTAASVQGRVATGERAGRIDPGVNPGVNPAQLTYKARPPEGASETCELALTNDILLITRRSATPSA
ncbi:MAG: hypothetical protein MUC50_16420 [Myxococcota bacterium]|nr:hypothetical protein [Myxococcota bacterium]